MKNKTMSFGRVEFDLLYDREATVALIEATIDGKIYSHTAAAKLTPGDKDDMEIGTKLALGRALEKLGRQLVRQGNGLVKCRDDNTAASKASKALREVEDLEITTLGNNKRRFFSKKAKAKLSKTVS